MNDDNIETINASACVQDETYRSELASLRAAFRFALTDGQRLLRESDVEDICPSKEWCFEHGDRVRCGPCAVKQAQKHGVETDTSLPFSPSEYRLK